MSQEQMNVRAAGIKALAAHALMGMMLEVKASTATLDEINKGIDRAVSQSMSSIVDDVKAECLRMLAELCRDSSAGKVEG